MKKSAQGTPRVSDTGNVASVLHRTTNGGRAQELAVTPSVGSSVVSSVQEADEGGSVVIDPSQLPTVLTQNSRLPRQRPRFHNVQDLDEALNRAIEGKITSKNAWASKEASNLLEGITHTIESTLEANAADDYSGFAKAATVVEGCSKVWTSRVDSTYLRSNQMVKRLLRNEETDNGNNEEETMNEEEGGGNAGGRGKKAKGHSERRPLARTIAMDVTEINLDSKAKVALTQTGINAQFRAITEKFDQGNAQGLLLSNAPFGSLGNLILDVDFSREQREFSARRSRQKARSSGTSSTRASDGSHTIKVEPAGNADECGGRISWSALVERDTEVNAQPEDLPVYFYGAPGEGTDDASHRSTGRDSRRHHSGHTDSPVGRPSINLDSLLVLPHNAVKEEVMTEHSNANSLRGSLGRIPDSAVPAEQYDDDMGGWDAYADGAGDDDMAGDFTTGAEANSVDIGAEGRQLVSGVTEMKAVDTFFRNGVRLALEAESPFSWCPLGDMEANPLMGTASNSELSRLRKQHHMFRPSSASHSETKGNPSSDMVSAGTSAGTGAPPTKRMRKDRSVVFQLPDAAEGGSSPVAFLNRTDIDDSALKQGRTETRSMTPLGKELVIGKDSTAAVLAYTQGAVQRVRAEQAGLLLPTPPTTGKTIPYYLPYPVVVASFFQPFSTTVGGWNLLCKSATGHLIDGSGQVSHRGSDPLLHTFDEGVGGEDEESALHGNMGDMPVEYIPAGAEADDYDDGGYGDAFASGAGDDDMDAYQQHINSVNEQLLAQLQNQATSASPSITAMHSPRSSNRVSQHGPLDVVQMLQVAQTTLPSQVDVVRLRQVMWTALQGELQHHEQTEDVQVAGVGSAEPVEVGRSEHEPKKGALKSHVRALMKRARPEAGIHGDEAASQYTDTLSAYCEEKGTEEAGATSTELLPHFSDVVHNVLPEVPNISTSGTLSPAFFFFSMLFLANEHNVILESSPTMDDLYVKGIARRVQQ